MGIFSKLINEERVKMLNKVLKHILAPNNRVTTLEIKHALRNTYPLMIWNQQWISEQVNKLVQEGKLHVFNDNGTYRTYGNPPVVVSKPVVQKPNLNLPLNKMVNLVMTKTKVAYDNVICYDERQDHYRVKYQRNGIEKYTRIKKNNIQLISYLK